MRFAPAVGYSNSAQAWLVQTNDRYEGGEILKRIISIFSLFAGIGVIAYCVYLAAVGSFENGFMLRNLQFFMVGFVLLALGIWGITKTKRGTAKNPKRRFPKALIIIGSVVLMLVLSVGVSLLTTQSNTSRIDKALRPYMREQYSETGAALPENARYILYDRAKDTYQYEARDILAGFEGNPDKVNTVVAFRIGTERIGNWETSSGMNVAGAASEYMIIEVIRLSDWALVDEQRFTATESSSRLNKKGEVWTYEVSIYDDEIVQYLNGLFDK
jgi:hypothetical protein